MKETAQPQSVRKRGKAHHHGGTQILPLESTRVKRKKDGGTDTMKLNEHYLSLEESYLFSEIAHRVSRYTA